MAFFAIKVCRDWPATLLNKECITRALQISTGILEIFLFNFRFITRNFWNFWKWEKMMRFDIMEINLWTTCRKSQYNVKIHCEINIKLVFHEMTWKKNFTVYPSLNIFKKYISQCILPLIYSKNIFHRVSFP